MKSTSQNDQQYFEALTQASIVSKSDTQGTIIYVNDNFCKVTGYAREEMIGKNHNMFRHPDNSDALYKEMWEKISQGEIWRERMTNRNKDGSDFIAETIIIPLIDAKGKIQEYMAIRNDVTDMVKLKREIFTKEQEKIEEEKIKEAQKSFLLVFTHELKTPLNAIINFTKYIKKQLESSKPFDKYKLIGLLESVMNNASDMLENITKILEISKRNAGKLSYHYNSFNIKNLITDMLKNFHSLIESKKIELVCDMQDDIMIHSDEYRVKQVITNIFSNAVKYGKDKILITLVQKDDITTLSITDNGAGIKNKEFIFDLYAQEDEELLERKSQGTGVGLHFIKNICEDLDIRYKVEDAYETFGTRFTLEFDSNSKKKEEE